MKQMQPWVTMVAAVACLALPAIGSAGEDTRLPQEREVSTAHEQASDGPRPTAMPAMRGPLSLSAAEVKYQRVNRTVHTN
jgi:hypothetical protein